MANDRPPMKSTASNPDLDWSQVRETILMLGVAIGQIESVMKEGDESVKVLTDSFTSMYLSAKSILDEVKPLADNDATRGIANSIEENGIFINSHVQKAIVAFQFYDRMAQRLDHVCRTIDSLADLITDSRRLYNPAEWAGIQTQIRSKYTMESERIMFDAILNGASVAEAIALSNQPAGASKPEDDIELF
ncbi:MAG: hypothetical protein Q8O37_06015 [Sulfuricellaceae bacterium]|nr:hypothetical protein [Sulfuricellaceae bacterium]